MTELKSELEYKPSEDIVISTASFFSYWYSHTCAHLYWMLGKAFEAVSCSLKCKTLLLWGAQLTPIILALALPRSVREARVAAYAGPQRETLSPTGKQSHCLVNLRAWWRERHVPALSIATVTSRTSSLQQCLLQGPQIKAGSRPILQE